MQQKGRRMMTMLGISVMGIATLLVTIGQLGGLTGHAPEQLGVTDGRLAPPALTPNSVSSQAKLYPEHPQHLTAQIDPFAYQGDGPQAMARLATLLDSTPRIQVMLQTPTYIRAQASTSVLRFTDDLEFWLDPTAQVIQVRSASRLGHSDLGANRARLEQLRARFTL